MSADPPRATPGAETIPLKDSEKSDLTVRAGGYLVLIPWLCFDGSERGEIPTAHTHRPQYGELKVIIPSQEWA